MSSPNHSSSDQSNEEETQLTISEVLTKIFSLLTLTDRKNVRLVCWNWYKAALHSSILKTEKFVCIREHDEKQTFDCLSRNTNCHPNLEFHGFSVDRSSIRFWRKRGHQIHSLNFVDCKFSKKAAKSVISRCNFVKEFGARSCSGFFSYDVFHYGTKKKITRSSLESIRIENDADISDYVFKQIFLIYPQVKSIAVSLINDRFYNVIYKNVYFEQATSSSTPIHESKNIFSHSAVYEKLRISSNSIRDLEYIEVDRDVSHMHNNFFDAVNQCTDLKLKKFCFSPSFFNIPSQTAFSTFFTRQDKLEYVVLKKSHFNSQFCSLLLDCCKNLRYLELADSNENRNHHTSESLSKDVLEKLVTSKLRNLKLHFDFRFEESNCMLNAEKNHSIHHLSVNSNLLSARNTLMLVEVFEGLTYLDFSSCHLDDELVQVILKCQVNLETLILSFNSAITDFGLTGKPLRLEHYMKSKETFSINRLKRLKILDLRDCLRITVSSLKEMVLPDLKFLSLENCSAISYNGFQVLGDNCPSLEYLDVCHTTISPESIVKLCRQLGRLHFLDITFCRVDELIMKVMLSCSESLRFVRHTEDVYYFHIFKKQWKTTKTRIRIETDGYRTKKCFSFDRNPSSVLKRLKCF